MNCVILYRRELSKAHDKFRNLTNAQSLSKTDITDVLHLFKGQRKTYKANYLILHRDELIPIKAEDIAYFYIDMGIVKGVTHQNKVFSMDKKLENLEQELNPTLFERANRQFIINRNAIAKIKHYFGGKLIVYVNPPASERIIVSKAKATQFKNWVNS
ncbi:LytTR family DNA-binding domain-containing protein [uncultured Croceitalea sp.]|uniref:LytR/AlgR family response regulator transcription factor n=1 Tax=uncultured Croceitalea sp. TaxID=1798908 RepID=UPI0033056C64